MKINEVASIVGLTHKSIRYYELQGLLKPKRNDNSYREYDEEDIKKLKLIKFLRELNIPIADIKKMQNKELPLSLALKEQIKKLEEQEKNYLTIKNMCKEIINKKETYENLDITKYSEILNILGKKGFIIKDEEKDNSKKIIGAVLSSLIFSLLFLFLIAIITYFELTEETKMPLILYLFFLFILLIPVLGIIINLIKRIKEIKGGEEYEARKY